MRYCERCQVEMFGGSLCHFCGAPLVERVEEKSVQMQPAQFVLGHRKRLRSDLAQGLTGRIVRVVIEMALFVALFVFVAHLAVGFSNWLSVEMAEEPEEAKGLINPHGDAFRYFLYFGGAAVAGLTFHFRFRSGK